MRRIYAKMKQDADRQGAVRTHTEVCTQAATLTCAIKTGQMRAVQEVGVFPTGAY